jgi:acyl-CoA synthetase (AMP-forming)/AMP-acid ligase II
MVARLRAGNASLFVRRQLRTVSVLHRTGIVRPVSPIALGRAGLALKRFGMGMAGGFGAAAAIHPHHLAIIDELGSLTYADVDERSTRLANGLAAMGLEEGDAVAVLCRNSRYFVDISVALAKLGIDVLYLNTAFAAPQLAEVCEREKPAAIVYDEEFSGLIDAAEVTVEKIVAFVDSDDVALPTLEELITSGSPAPRIAPDRLARAIILTSGTTGTPKGAPRSEAGIDAGASVLSRMHLRQGWTTHIAAPMFHTWGFAHLNLAMLLGSTMVLRRRFDPEDCLRTVSEHHCDSLVVIPVMLQRMLRLPAEVIEANPVPDLKATTSSGSALPGALGTEWMDTFGDNLFNIYGSTEVAWVSIATPADLRAAPGSAGKPPLGTVVRLYDEQDGEVPAGSPGRIFVGNSMLFEGYTGGGNKATIDGLMSIGDVGRFDDRGYLFVEGRDDEMIVSGGENVFPKEVEDCLSRHELVVEAAALGVDDEEFGKRLRAFVVTSGEVGEDDLKDWVKANLARFKVPREIVFLDELPRNATGKLLKRELKDYPA